MVHVFPKFDKAILSLSLLAKFDSCNISKSHKVTFSLIPKSKTEHGTSGLQEVKDVKDFPWVRAWQPGDPHHVVRACQRILLKLVAFCVDTALKNGWNFVLKTKSFQCLRRSFEIWCTFGVDDDKIDETSMNSQLVKAWESLVSGTSNYSHDSRAKLWKVFQSIVMPTEEVTTTETSWRICIRKA